MTSAPIRPARRRLLAAVSAAAVLTSLGLGISAAPTGAATTVVTPGNLGPWVQSAFDCSTAGALATTQKFVTGPATPPAGSGSLEFDLSTKNNDFTDVITNDTYKGTPIDALESAAYSTFVSANAKEGPAIGFGIDKNGDGTWDEDLTFYPSENGTVTPGTWQTWSVTTASTMEIETNVGSTPTTLGAYQASAANNAAKLVYVAVAYGCGTVDEPTNGTTTHADKVSVKFGAASEADVFDFEPAPAAPAPGPPANPNGGNGYRMVAADGGIFTFGERTFHGSTGDLKLNKPIVGGATDTSDYDGYWIVASDGGIFTFNAAFYGSLGDQKIAAPAVEIEPTPTGNGYFIVLANGKVYTFGDANFAGDLAGKALNKPIIGMSVTPTGKGYWLVGADGGIFNFGDAGFFGSMGDKKLNAPIIDLAPAVDNKGYYLLGGDGGVFTFGSADFKGSTGDLKLNAPVVAMLVNPAGSGYWLAASDGGIFTFGAGASFLGSMGGTKLNSPVLDLIN